MSASDDDIPCFHFICLHAGKIFHSAAGPPPFSAGTFDCMARLTLKELKKEFRGISLCLLPAYHPSDAKMEWVEAQDYDLIYPDEVANAPPQVAILRRNDYIVKNAEYIVCYITHNSGGTYKAAEKARKHKKKIINLAEYV